MLDQRKLVRELFAQDTFTLIVLDACRFDTLMSFMDEDGMFPTGDGGAIKGFPKKALSPATHTYVWFQRIFDGWYPNTEVFSGHPVINSDGATPPKFMPTINEGTFISEFNHPWEATDHFQSENIHDAWRETDEIENFGSDPEPVAARVRREGYGDRNIVWLMAPHAPYSDRGDTSRERYRNALADVLPLVGELVDAPGRVVVTSDHGEVWGAPGEYGLERITWKDELRHEPGVRVPGLTNVPWVEVSRYIPDY
jgi:hypothetical protein